MYRTFILGVLAVACGGDNSRVSDKARKGSSISQSDFDDSYTSWYCDHLSTCDAETFDLIFPAGSVEDCKAFIGSFESLPGCDFDGSEGEQCLDDLEASDCENWLTAYSDSNACSSVYTGDCTPTGSYDTGNPTTEATRDGECPHVAGIYDVVGTSTAKECQIDPMPGCEVSQSNCFVEFDCMTGVFCVIDDLGHCDYDILGIDITVDFSFASDGYADGFTIDTYKAYSDEGCPLVGERQ